MDYCEGETRWQTTRRLVCNCPSNAPPSPGLIAGFSLHHHPPRTCVTSFTCLPTSTLCPLQSSSTQPGSPSQGISWRNNTPWPPISPIRQGQSCHVAFGEHLRVLSSLPSHRKRGTRADLLSRRLTVIQIPVSLLETWHRAFGLSLRGCPAPRLLSCLHQRSKGGLTKCLM